MARMASLFDAIRAGNTRKGKGEAASFSSESQNCSVSDDCGSCSGGILAAAPKQGLRADAANRAASVPLAFVSSGDRAVVSVVRGSKEARRHLESLGFVEGAQVGVVCETAGSLIVEVKGAQVALDRQVAMKVAVCF
ncbi:MAG: FeoA family protein [Slackia sp.]|nr:FeoA family protein [Slackia sp.]